MAAAAEKLFGGQVIVEADIKTRALGWLPAAMRFAPEAEPECGQDGDGAEPSDGADAVHGATSMVDAPDPAAEPVQSDAELATAA